MKIKNIRTSVPTEVTRDGETFTINKHVDRQVISVFDVHRAVRRAVTAATVLVVGIALAWSVTSIGALLALAAPVWVAYLAAGAFDLSWAVLMAAEWSMQYDDRAKIPRTAGWIALAVSMTAIATEGRLHAGLWIGIIGAVISLLAKGLWTVMMMITAHPLSDESYQIVQQRRSRAGEELALTVVDRELIRIRQETAALRESGSLTAVAWDAQGITRKALAETLADAIDDGAESGSGSQQPDRSGSGSRADPVRRIGSGPVEHFVPRSGSIKELVQSVMDEGITDPAAVLAEVRADRPDANPETVKRMVRLHRVNGSG
ncbi:hypothetical protein [Streptomyces spinosisporus]|uniref:Protein transporter Sec31 n=1 Tax=Streptomyces spinosisporus TaxID=2927582 RepID=A0ABS9XA77_9ACTN|nr:hypothetical protein [Streptomyces spinosisporus]MCI3238206.1 hypothetical protein [Streptomyces spinosisporus]